MQNSKICPVCKGSDHTINDYLDPVWPNLNLFKDLDIVCCDSCGFGYCFPEIPDQLVGDFYKHHYRSILSPYYLNLKKLKHGVSNRAAAQISLALKETSFGKGEIFLDIGPGDGYSFGTAVKLLESPQCIAIELTKGAKEAYKSIYKAETYPSIDELVKRGIKAKIIVLSHSLEHYKLASLRSFLKELKKILAPNASVVVEVPNDDLREQKFTIQHSPHFLFFSQESLKMIFEEQGYRIKFIGACSETYDEWAEKSKHYTFQAVPKSGIKNFIRSTAVYQMLKPLISSMPEEEAPSTIDYQSSEFMYSDDRICLRLLATLD